ncbi:MAG: BamA/TamA family outer membrane protein [Campylobacterota bacterium]|nr:BamA/TamA family outer membrane protein [Campylobacterota bacterium]
MYQRVIIIFLLSVVVLWSDSNETNSSRFSLFSSKKEVVLPSKKIQFKFIGEQNLDESDLQNAMSVDVKSKFQFWKEYNPKIKEKLLPTLPATLRSYLDSEGYYDATYTIKITKTDVIVTIKEDKPVRVNDINITSDYDIQKLVTFEKDEIFTAEKFISIKSKIVKEMMKNGYCSYSLDSKAYVDLDTYRVDLKYLLKKGGVCTFGKVTIKGLDTIKEKVVISRVRAREGSRFNTEHIQQSYDALYALNSFDYVAVKYDRKFYNVVPIDIVASEISKPWYFMAGVKYDTNVGAGVQTEIIRKNFMGGAKKLRVQLQYSQIEQLAEVMLFTPAMFGISGYYLDLATKIGYSNLEYTGFMEKKGYAEAFLTYTNEVLELDAGFAIENIDISLLEDYDEGKLTQAVEPGTFFLAYPFLRFTLDRRDSKLNPKYGYYLSGMMEYGLPYDGEANEYIKYEIEGRGVYTLHNLTMAAVAKVGILDEIENHVPESKRFFGGGAYSNRAYGYKRMGVIFSPTRYGIEGASTMANLSLEVDYPIWGDIYGAVFNDNTMLTINSYDFTGDIISSAGVGIRYVTPIGPIKIDVGMNVRDISQYGIQFQIGQSF